jgi:hypothetical protein
MKAFKDNPSANSLGKALTEEELGEAVSKSGFPLQTIVAEKLEKEFWVQEEWSFIDKDTGALRALDIHGTKELWDFKGKQPHVRPGIEILVECKRSLWPYVFFLTNRNMRLLDFPLNVGLRKDSVVLKTDDDRSSWSETIPSVLSLAEENFAWRSAPVSMSFGKCIKQNSKTELVGEPFQELVLPLTKAMHHVADTHAVKQDASYYDCLLILGVGVLDAPMVGVAIKDEKPEINLIPWVRVMRHETSASGERWWQRETMVAIDVIHKDFLESYINDHLLPFAKVFGKRVLSHQKELQSCEGFASGLGKDSWSNLEKRLRPR